MALMFVSQTFSGPFWNNRLRSLEHGGVKDGPMSMCRLLIYAAFDMMNAGMILAYKAFTARIYQNFPRRPNRWVEGRVRKHLAGILECIGHQPGQSGVFVATNDGAAGREAQQQPIPLRGRVSSFGIERNAVQFLKEASVGSTAT